jgi:hypothetical protein
MKLLETIRPQMTVADVEAKLGAAGIAFDLRQSRYGDGPTIELQHDGWNISIDFDARSQCVLSRGAWRLMPLDDALLLVRETVGADTVRLPNSPPKEAFANLRETQRFRGTERDVKLSWTTPERVLVVSISEGDVEARLRCDMHGDPMDGRTGSTRCRRPPANVERRSPACAIGCVAGRSC